MNIQKLLFLVGCFFITTHGFSQKANIQSAINYLKDNDIANAKKMIDEAVNNESTKSSAKAWLLRGVINQAIATPAEFMPKLNFILNENPYMIDMAAANTLKGANPNAASEAVESYKKALSLDSKYEKQEILPLLGGLVILAHNTGIANMHSSKFNDAIKSFEDVINVSKIDGGKPFQGIGGYDTIFANTKLYQAKSYYQANQEDLAIPMFEEAIRNPLIEDVDSYVILTEIYERKNNEAKWNEIMKLAKVKYPAEKRIIDNEISFYNKTGRVDELIAKLKEAVSAEPKKGYNYIVLGQTYYNKANPIDKEGKVMASPANAAELEANALANYAKAIDIDMNDPYPQFYSGVVHYNAAKIMTDEMNKADDKKYKEMEPKRNAKIELGIPFLLKAKSLIEAEGVREDKKTMYKQILSGLAQSYMVTDKADKSTEMQNLLNSVK
ncbi:MAG: hypothetical protein IPK62_05370 [Bacteroidetes bacterium]|nr:hypothetical protein [Bacteroidota bacterium]